MNILTVFLLLILLIILFDQYSHNKEKYTAAHDFRTQQYKSNDKQLESTKHAMHRNIKRNSEIDSETIKNNKILNNKVCTNAKFYNFDNIDETNRSYDNGLIIKPDVISGIPKLGTQFEIIENDNIYSKCQPNINIDISKNCANFEQQCFDVNGKGVTYKGDSINDDNDNMMCKYTGCANQCSIQQRYCYTSNNSDGFVREKIFMDKCIHHIENNCVLLSDNEFLENNIIDLCPYKTYYHVFDSNGTNDGRELHFYDKSVELMTDGTTYKCLYDTKKEHTTNTFDSLDDLLKPCGLSDFQSDLQCYSHLEDQKFIYNTAYPHNIIDCRYYPNETCYFSMTDNNNSNILCEYNSYNGETKECVLPITCNKSLYTHTSEEHVGDVKSETYDKIMINGQFQEETIDGNKYMNCVYHDTPSVDVSTESFISEPQYFDKITCSNLRCGQGIMHDLPNGQVQCVFHNCPSDVLIHTNNKLSKSTNRLTKLQASQKLTQDKIDEFQNIQKSIDKDTGYIKNQKYLLNNKEEQIIDKAIRTSSKLDAFKSIDTTLRRKISNTNKQINKLRNNINRQTHVYEDTIIEGFSMEETLLKSASIANAEINDRRTQEENEKRKQDDIINRQNVALLSNQTRLNSENEAIKNNRIEEEQLNKELNEHAKQLEDLGLSRVDQADIEETSINQYNEKEAIMNEIERLRNELHIVKNKHKVLLDVENEITDDRNNDPKYKKLQISNMLTAIKDENTALKKDFSSLTECNKSLNPKRFLDCVFEDFKKTNTLLTKVEKEKYVAIQAKKKAEADAVKARLDATAKIAAAKIAAEKKAAAEKAAAAKIAAYKVLEKQKYQKFLEEIKKEWKSNSFINDSTRNQLKNDIITLKQSQRYKDSNERLKLSMESQMYIDKLNLQQTALCLIGINPNTKREIDSIKSKGRSVKILFELFNFLKSKSKCTECDTEKLNCAPSPAPVSQPSETVSTSRECIRYVTYYDEGGQNKFCEEWSDSQTPASTTSEPVAPATSSILFPNANNEYNIRRVYYYLGRKCEKSIFNQIKDTFGSPVEGTSEYLPNNDIAVFDANFKGIKLDTNQRPRGIIGDKFSFHHKGDNKYKIKNTVINKWIKNSPNRISYRVGAGIKFYKPSINYLDNEADANEYAITLDGTNYKINFGHGDKNDVYFIENADTSVEYDRGYYTCNKKYDRSSFNPAEPTELLYITGTSIGDQMDCENTFPIVLPNYPIITRTTHNEAKVKIAFNCSVKLDWIIVPTSENCVIDSIAKFRRFHKSNKLLYKDHGIPNCVLKYFGSTNLLQTVQYKLTFSNLKQNESYKLYIKPKRQIHHTEAFFSYDIPKDISVEPID